MLDQSCRGVIVLKNCFPSVVDEVLVSSLLSSLLDKSLPLVLVDRIGLLERKLLFIIVIKLE